jgi:hypothetical protein
MRILWLIILTVTPVFAGVNLLDYELGLRRRAELLSRRSFERTKILMGIDPETCKRVTDPSELKSLLKRQIETIRSIGELNHCEHLVTLKTQNLSSELANFPLPQIGTGNEANKLYGSSGKILSKEFQDDYLEPSSLNIGRKFVDPLFKIPSPTEFAGHKMSVEGMHALRVFYSGEPALKPQAAPRLKYPLAANETFYHYPECRIIVSGGLEITSVIASYVQDAGHNQSCAEACDTKLNAWLAEKKPASYLMTCHHLGEIVSMKSRGTPAEQGIKQIYIDGTSKHIIGTCLVRVRNGAILVSGPVVYRAECLGRFKDAYLNYERNLPLVSPGATAHVIDAYLLTQTEERLASATIKSYPLPDFKNSPEKKCHADDIVLLKNLDKTSEVRSSTGDCLSWCLADFRAFTQPGARGFGGDAEDWHYRCTDVNGDTLLLCSLNRKKGCR